MRGLLLALLLAAPAGAQSLYPQNWKPIVGDHWGGLNLLQDSARIDGDAQSGTQNVLTDNSFLEKRPGNVRIATILPGYPVQYVNDWVSASGNRYLIAEASSTIYQTNFSGAPVVLSSVAANANITTVAAFSKLEFADGFRPLWYWNANTTGTVTDANTGNLAPVCTYVDFKDNRIWCANLPVGFSIAGNTQNGGGSSTVLVSSKGTDGYWSVPANVGLVDDAPNRFDLNPNDGDQINCLAKTPWGEFVGKRNSSYIIKGNGNLSYDARLLDPKIGCVDNRSVQMVNGVLEWLAVDGVYGYVGSGPPQLLTRELDPLMQTIREATFSQGQWATQLQPDWASGTQSTVSANLPTQGPWDFNTIPGIIAPSSGTLYDDNTNPNLQTCTTNINPASNLPWTCGVGFSSDAYSLGGSLTNIDTTTFPLSIGFAQVLPSSTSLNVWRSSYEYDANYAAHYPYWTLFANNMFLFSQGGTTGIAGSNNNSTPNTIYSTNASTAGQATNGSMSGYWSLDWGIFDDNSDNRCRRVGGAGSGGSECFEYFFISTGAVPSANLYGYKLEVDMVSAGNYSLLLDKVKNGVVTTIGSWAFTNTSCVSSCHTDKVAVTRTIGGAFYVYYDGALVIAAQDQDPSITLNAMNVFTTFSEHANGPPAFNCQNFVSTFTYNAYGTGSIVSRIYDIGTVTPLAGVLSSSYTLQGVGSQTEIDFYVRNSSSPHNDMWSSWQASSNSVLAVLPKRYWQYEALFSTLVSSYTPQLASVELTAVPTGYYYSKVNFIGPLITSWLQFGVTENTPGTYGYAVRQATYAFAPGAASPAWVSQTANQNVNLSISTPTYAQFRLDSTALLTNPQGASAAEPISAVFLRWNQGANIPVASDTLERRYILCVAISSAATAPDTCLLRQKTGKWIPWTITTTVGAMGYYNNQQIAADGGTSSNVWEIMQPNVYSDDGVPINSIWVSADETDNLPFNNKNYYGVLIDAQPVLMSSVTFSYAMNKTTTYNVQPFTTDNGQALDPTKPVIGTQLGSITQWLPAANNLDSGKYIRAQFSDNTLDNYFRINSYILFVIDNPWQPGP